MPPSDTKSPQSKSLDKFYTRPEVAKQCIDDVAKWCETEWHSDWSSSFDLVVEPSAGSGSFFSQLPTSVPTVGLDILPEPGSQGIVTHDFFEWTPSKCAETTPEGAPAPSRTLVIGNPPFGRVSSLAIRFFNHAAQWATVIAFIVPRTFRRVSVCNKLDLHFHKAYDRDVPLKPCAFTPPMMAKCCFQIWVRKDDVPPRQVVHLPTQHPHWTFLPFGPTDASGQPTPPEGADFAIRAYGGRCGDIRRTALDTLRPKSWHWIQTNGTVDAETLAERFETLDYSLSEDTARQNSIGRGEVVMLYSQQAWDGGETHRLT